MVDLDLKAILSGGTRIAERFGDEAYFVALCVRSGLIGPELPHRVAQIMFAFERYGLIGGALQTAAIRSGARIGVIDERGTLSYKELDERSNRLANSWRVRGLQAGEGVAILACNHGWFLDATFAAAKCGARIVLLNMSFAARQIREVAGREGTDLVVYDGEYAEMLEGIELQRGRFRAWTDEQGTPRPDTLEALIEQAEPGTAGKVVRGAMVKILDPDGNDAAPGTTGEIYVGNAFQFEGYTGGGDKRRVRGLMSSGDVGHFDAEGRLFIDGRADEMIVSGGENVFPAEVEELLASHRDIAEAAAIGVEDDEFGQRLRAFVVLREGASLDEQQIRDFVRDNLARYKVPREMVFVDELPRNPSGKVLKRELAQIQP